MNFFPRLQMKFFFYLLDYTAYTFDSSFLIKPCFIMYHHENSGEIGN